MCAWRCPSSHKSSVCKLALAPLRGQEGKAITGREVTKNTRREWSVKEFEENTAATLQAKKGMPCDGQRNRLGYKH